MMSEIRNPCDLCLGAGALMRYLRGGPVEEECTRCHGTGDEPDPSESELEQAGQERLL